MTIPKSALLPLSLQFLVIGFLINSVLQRAIGPVEGAVVFPLVILVLAVIGTALYVKNNLMDKG